MLVSNEVKRRLIIATLAFIIGAKACPQTHTVISKSEEPTVSCLPTPCKPVPCYDAPPEAKRVNPQDLPDAALDILSPASQSLR